MASWIHETAKQTSAETKLVEEMGNDVENTLKDSPLMFVMTHYTYKIP